MTNIARGRHGEIPFRSWYFSVMWNVKIKICKAQQVTGGLASLPSELMWIVPLITPNSL